MTILAFAGGAIQLVPDGTLLFHLVLIIVMIAVLNRTLLKPINRILEARDTKTKGRFREAEDALAAARAAMSDYERKVREARAGGYKLIEEERVAASTDRNQRLSAVRAEVGAWRDEEKARVLAAESEARARLAAEAQNRAAEISSRILGRSVSR